MFGLEEISTILIEVKETVTPFEAADLDLTSLTRFPRLKELWINGYPEQRLEIVFNKHENMTSLPLEHLHLHIKLRFRYVEDDFYFKPNGVRGFLEMLHKLKTIDLRNTVDPKFLLKTFFHAIANQESLKVITLQYLQSMQLNYKLQRQLNLTEVFPAYFAKSVRYLDLSRNDFETLAGNLILGFTSLKYLDVSYNKLAGGNPVYHQFVSCFFFHPYIQVIVLENQGKDTLGERTSYYQVQRQRRDVRLQLNEYLGPQNYSNCLRHWNIFMSHTKLCQTINCILNETDDFVPCEYLPKPALNFTNTIPIIIPTAPNLQQLKMGSFLQNQYPGSYLSEKTSVEFATNLRSVDVSDNSYIIAFLDYQTVDVYGFERLEEFKMANIQLLNREYYNISDLSMFPGLKRLYLNSNSLFIPADFRLCHMFPNITVLDISNCKLQQLPQHFLDGCKHLQLLNVSANQMTSIPNSLRNELDDIQDVHDLSVDFSNNPFYCHCHKYYYDVISMIHWMRDTNVNLVDARSYQCTGNGQMELLLEKDTDIYNDMCSINEEIIQAVVSTLGACIAVALVTVCTRIAYRLRYRLKTWYYKRQLFRGRQNSDVTSEFDIYIGYDDSDKFFVIYELTHILETVYGFRCCIPDRDFDGEGVHTELISHFLGKCQMSIIVLSRQALQNPIHFIERNLARQLELHSFQMRKVIYIFMEDLSDVTISDVRSVISSKVGLFYSNDCIETQQRFFEKLRCKVYKTLRFSPLRS